MLFRRERFLAASGARRLPSVGHPVLQSQVRFKYFCSLQVAKMTNPTITPVARDDWEGHWRDYTDAAEHNPAQRYRRQLACKLLRRFRCSRGARILDIGSGHGDPAADLHRSFPPCNIARLRL